MCGKKKSKLQVDTFSVILLYFQNKIASDYETYTGGRTAAADPFSILHSALHRWGLSCRDSLVFWLLLGFGQREAPAGDQWAEETRPSELAVSLY